MSGDGAAGGRLTRTDAIAHALRNAIIEQALTPGTRLPEDAIGEQFDASRTIVRAALSLLSAEGLVAQRRNRGAVVAEPSWEEARDTFELRIALERIVVARLAGTLGPREIAALRAHVAEEEEARKAGSEPRSIRLGGEFHVKLAELHGSSFLLRYTRELTSRCCLILALYSRPISAECGVAEHLEIIDHLAAGAADKAVAVMTSHLGAVVERALIKPQAKTSESISEILARYSAS
jgi:DNA-binding GntR family transcriptional regulator